MVIARFWSTTAANSADSQRIMSWSKIPISHLGKKSVSFAFFRRPIDFHSLQRRLLARNNLRVARHPFPIEGKR